MNSSQQDSSHRIEFECTCWVGNLFGMLYLRGPSFQWIPDFFETLLHLQFLIIGWSFWKFTRETRHTVPSYSKALDFMSNTIECTVKFFSRVSAFCSTGQLGVCLLLVFLSSHLWVFRDKGNSIWVLFLEHSFISDCVLNHTKMHASTQMRRLIWCNFPPLAIPLCCLVMRNVFMQEFIPKQHDTRYFWAERQRSFLFPSNIRNELELVMWSAVSGRAWICLQTVSRNTPLCPIPLWCRIVYIYSCMKFSTNNYTSMQTTCTLLCVSLDKESRVLTFIRHYLELAGHAECCIQLLANSSWKTSTFRISLYKHFPIKKDSLS